MADSSQQGHTKPTIHTSHLKYNYSKKGKLVQQTYYVSNLSNLPGCAYHPPSTNKNVNLQKLIVTHKFESHTILKNIEDSQETFQKRSGRGRSHARLPPSEAG